MWIRVGPKGSRSFNGIHLKWIFREIGHNHKGQPAKGTLELRVNTHMAGWHSGWAVALVPPPENGSLFASHVPRFSLRSQMLDN